MVSVREQDDVTIIAGEGELSRDELAELADVARRARRDGRRVVVDLSHVEHLHYAGAAALKTVPGLRTAGASQYVRDLVAAGGAGAHVEHFGGVDDATFAA